jgi:cytochrome c5
MKTCSKCLQEFPATTEYFYKKPPNAFGVDSVCKVCHRAGKKEWYKNNTELKLARDKANYERNKEAILKRNQEYYYNNIDKHRNKRSKQRARRKNVYYEPYTEAQMLEKYGTDCYLCSSPIDMKAPRQVGKPGWEKGLHKEHIIAISNDGPDTLANVRPAHGLCNLNKSNKEIYEKN